jgi:hypothetical protein
VNAPDESRQWDGHGVDPWLPARLSAAAEIAAAERSVYAQMWAELSRWLVSVARRVLAAIRPDPHAVWAGDADWRQAVDRIVGGPVRQILADVYVAVLGAGYRFDQRPAVVAHLAEVANRMVRTTGQVFDLVAGEVTAGSQLGESIPQIAARIEHVLSATATERWRDRATTVARTETLSALNAGRDDAWTAVAAELAGDDVVLERQWLSAADGRTRATHQAADGLRSPIGGTFTVGGAVLRRPGDPLGPPEEVINCRCTIMLVEAGETVDLSNRQLGNY